MGALLIFVRQLDVARPQSPEQVLHVEVNELAQILDAQV